MKLPALLASLGVVLAQTPGALTVADAPKITVARKTSADHKLRLEVKEGYHVNSHKPNDEYLIPIKLTWADGPLEAAQVSYPTPKVEEYSFSEKPLSVFDGSFEVTTKFKPKADAAPGMGFVNGKLRYQACNDKMCLPPKTIDIKVPVLIQ
jgi:hypothetical protein